MRDILFRGKRLENGAWVYGSLLQVECEDGSIVTAIFDRKDSGGDAEVHSSTVGQYTGLKDKNGERIWEGDIVKGRYSGKVAEVQAEVWNCGCCHGVLGFSTGTSDPDIGDTLVVIGNIYDNTELLEGGASE